MKKFSLVFAAAAVVFSTGVHAQQAVDARNQSVAEKNQAEIARLLERVEDLERRFDFAECVLLAEAMANLDPGCKRGEPAQPGTREGDPANSAGAFKY